jgi:hypothetical protein
MGGRGNSWIAKVFHFIVGESEPSEMATALSINISDCIKKGRRPGIILSGISSRTIA